MEELKEWIKVEGNFFSTKTVFSNISYFIYFDVKRSFLTLQVQLA